MLSDAVVETGHDGAVTDVAVDHSGKRLATAGEDGTVRIYELQSHDGGATVSWRPLTTLEVQAGPVLCLAWAPMVYYSAAVVVCSESRKLTLWSDFTNTKQYECVYSSELPAAGWCVAWAPQEYGKLFAVGCADGTVMIYTGEDKTWGADGFNAHQGGCCGLSWAPFFPPGSLLLVPLESELEPETTPPPLPISPPRLLTCDGGPHITLWRHSFTPVAMESGEPAGEPESVWTPVEMQAPVTGAWREVAWAPNVGLPFTYIAAGSEEGLVVVWRQDGPADVSPWHATVLPKQDASITKLSWSQAGTFLLASCADGTATMFKEVATGKWQVVSELENPTL